MSSLFKLFIRNLRIPGDKSPETPSVRSFLVKSRMLPKHIKHSLIAVLALGGLFLAMGITVASDKLLVRVPVKGGILIEGAVGSPRFINPLLATSDADKDLVALVYSGLLRSAKLERYETDLAESYSISQDGTVYTFKLKEGLYWHDGSPVTSADIIFTIQMAQDDRVKSPRRANWDGVKAEAPDDHTVVLTTKEAYAPFIENTTMGILPEHLWRDVRPEEFSLHTLNLRPVGTGPYAIKIIQYGENGVPTQVKLSAFNEFALGSPKIEEIHFKFFQNEENLLKEAGAATDMSISGLSAEAYLKIVGSNPHLKTLVLPRVFAIFFNQNQSAILADKSVRQALDLASPKEKIVELAMGGLGQAINSPLPWTGDRNPDKTGDPAKILESAGWKVGEDGIRSKNKKALRIELATANSPELKKAAAIISESWLAIGVDTVVKIYEASDLNVNVIRPRKFDALLFGESLGHYPDPYAFWHSSQRLDPYLNVAQYTNSKADKALEIIRTTTSLQEHGTATKTFLGEIRVDIPAVFLYSPSFVYLANQKIKGLEIPFFGGPADRFKQVHKWYLDTEKLWPIFK